MERVFLEDNSVLVFSLKSVMAFFRTKSQQKKKKKKNFLNLSGTKRTVFLFDTVFQVLKKIFKLS